MTSGDKQPWRDRLDERLVRAAVVVSERLSGLLKPGSFLIFFAASLFALGTLLREAHFPEEEFWKPRSLAMYALLFFGAITYSGYVLVVWGYRRSLSARDREAQLYRACRDVAALVERSTSLQRDSIGVHVWTVRGLPGVRRLERQATFVPGDRPPTAIVWRRGKGAIGRCWDRDEWILADLEALQALAPNESAFNELSRDERFAFTWSELRSTEHYKAVLAWPLHGGPEAAPHVVGCLSIDVQENGAAQELDRFRLDHHAVFSAHLAVCEAILRAR
ncbi:MAG: hypothetical protein M3N29_00780 [Chloroflexota bacterium]|nr:hypothetical protein [Chloroflexota bacterium]